MKRQTALSRLVLFALAAGAGSTSAHHSIAHDFDVFQEVKLTGTVRRVKWANPHIGLELDVSNPNGTTTLWRVEGGPPNALLRRGWTRDSLKAGETVVVEGYPARDGSRRANARAFILGDGVTLDAASSYAPRPRR